MRSEEVKNITIYSTWTKYSMGQSASGSTFKKANYTYPKAQNCQWSASSTAVNNPKKSKSTSDTSRTTNNT